MREHNTRDVANKRRQGTDGMALARRLANMVAGGARPKTGVLGWL